jgi:tetratricopeptide (TPR) repeat protein
MEMEDFNLYEKIEAYLKGELSAEAAKTFAAEIAANADLQQQVALHRLEEEAMEVVVENDLRGKMATWDSQKSALDTPSVKEAKTVNRDTAFAPMTVVRGGNFTRYAWAAAASVTILAAAMVWFWDRPAVPTENQVNQEQPQNQPVSPVDTTEEILFGSGIGPVDTTTSETVEKKGKEEKKVPLTPPTSNIVPPNTNEFDGKNRTVAEDAYAHSDVPSYKDATANRGTNSTNNLDAAGKAYDRKQYATAIDILKNTPVSDENLAAIEILAHAYFQSKNYKAAVPAFQNLLKLSGRRSQEKSEWYLLLTYLANGKAYQAQFEALAKKITDNKEHEYSASVRSLLSELSKK